MQEITEKKSKLTEKEYILKAASLYGLEPYEIKDLEKDLDGTFPNPFMRRKYHDLFDLYKVYKSTEYNDHIDTDDDGIISLNQYSYKVSRRRLNNSVIGKGWIISSNLDAYLIVPPAKVLYDIAPVYNNIAEKNNYLIPWLARQVGIPAVVYYRAEKIDPESSDINYMRLTKNFIGEDESLIMANTFIKPPNLKGKKTGSIGIDTDKMIDSTVKFIKKHYKKNGLSPKEAKDDSEEIRKGIIKQTIFNKLGFNRNEDNDQWGLIEDLNTHKLRLAPIFNYNYFANVESRHVRCCRKAHKSDRIEDIMLWYSNEPWFKKWVDEELVSLDIDQAEQKMNEKTGETLSDEEREYYKLVIMDKMHSKVVGVSELGYDTDKVEEARTDSHVDRVMRKFGIRRNMPKPPDGSDVPNDPTR